MSHVLAGLEDPSRVCTCGKTGLGSGIFEKIGPGGGSAIGGVRG